jgi:hypothetical protein
VISRNCRQFLVDFFFLLRNKGGGGTGTINSVRGEKDSSALIKTIKQQIIFNGRITKRNCFEAFENSYAAH